MNTIRHDFTVPQTAMDANNIRPSPTDLERQAVDRLSKFLPDDARIMRRLALVFQEAYLAGARDEAEMRATIDNMEDGLCVGAFLMGCLCGGLVAAALLHFV